MQIETAARAGGKTSEFKLALISQLVGVVVLVLGMFFPDLPSEEIREVLVWLAGLLIGGGAAGYGATRAVVKRQLARTTGDA